MKYLGKNYRYFADREGRAAFIAHEFASEIKDAQSVLDVGCDNNTLKKIVGPKVTGVDLYGTPDIVIDFDKEKLSRFVDDQFDFSVCTEVLEHLESFYEMNDELFRVSKRLVLISLPNSMDIFTKWQILLNERAGKFYGLPLEKPADRHRWFFSYKDVDRFYEAYAKKRGFRIERKFLHYNFSDSWKGTCMRLLARVTGLSSAAQSYWILIRKKNA